MNKTEIEELVNQPVPLNHMVIEIGYRKYVLSHKDGLKVLDGLAQAEMLVEEYPKDPKITPLVDKDSPNTTMISDSFYRESKMRYYLVGLEDENL